MGMTEHGNGGPYVYPGAEIDIKYKLFFSFVMSKMTYQIQLQKKWGSYIITKTNKPPWVQSPCLKHLEDTTWVLALKSIRLRQNMQ